ncbi:LOW QUALITY PROTEIN: zinc finger C2HC domain-containing protein 1A-like [Bolinopsis microptera]|uniref:LOW QUALITY PROTEIN: zinc finger C2HC domain-containing protein 1A-like n=1 Tax=Bolinopsis microptera TaxID=2820187 RepID=UPI0030796266
MSSEYNLMNILEDQCPTCYRTFNPDVLKKHLPICNKVNTKVRKPMDIQKMRVAGTDIKLPAKSERVVEEKPKKSGLERKARGICPKYPIRGEAKAAEARGETIAPPPPSTKPSDHVECPTCGRSFNPNAAERHVKFCAEQAKRKPAMTTKAAAAKEKLDKMKGFKSTFDKRKQQQQQQAPARNAGGVRGAPQSRTLRETENKSAPTPLRTGIPSRYADKQVEDDWSTPIHTYHAKQSTPEEHIVRPEKKLLNNLNARLNGGPPSRKVSSARGPPAEPAPARAGSGRGVFRGDPGSKNPPYCYDCGYKYPVKTARFCCECGEPRLRNDG